MAIIVKYAMKKDESTVINSEIAVENNAITTEPIPFHAVVIHENNLFMFETIP